MGAAVFRTASGRSQSAIDPLLFATKSAIAEAAWIDEHPLRIDHATRSL
jgi:hypothetical protein